MMILYEKQTPVCNFIERVISVIVIYVGLVFSVEIISGSGK